MTRASIKIIYLTILWTLICPFLQCFSLLNPLNYIPLLTCIQSLQAVSIRVSEESYDKINEALRDNPDLLKQLIAQYGSSKSKFQSFPKRTPVMNGISSIFPRFGSSMYSVKNPTTVALPKEFISDGQKYVVTNRLNLLGNFFKKVTSAITSPIASSFNYLKNLGQNQQFRPDTLKSISNRLKISKRNDDDEEEEEEGEEEEEEEEEEEKPKKSSKKKSKDKKNTKKNYEKKKKAKKEEEEEDDDDDDDDEDEEETQERNPKKSNKKGNNMKKEKDDDKETEETDEVKNPKKSDKEANNRKRQKDDEDDDEDDDDDDDEDDDEETNEVKNPKKSDDRGNNRKRQKDDEEDDDEDEDGEEDDEED